MSFYGVTDLWTYVIGAIFIILLPGPNSLYVLSVATGRGVRAGYQGALGVFLGDSILILLVALGAAGVLHTQPALFLVVKYVGAAYLFWLGLNLIAASWRRWAGKNAVPVAVQQAPGEASSADRAADNLQSPFRRALLISLLNPKAILFLLSFFVQFIDPGYATPAVPLLILSAILMSLSALYLSCLIFLGARLAQAFRARVRLSAFLSSLVGGVFLWFGTKLATASLN